MDQTVLHVWNALGTVLGTLLIMSILLWTSRQLITQMIGVWRLLRGYQDGVIGAVDEPDDPVIEQLARLSGLPASIWAAFFPAFLRALAEELDALLEAEERVTTQPATYFEEASHIG